MSNTKRAISRNTLVLVVLIPLVFGACPSCWGKEGEGDDQPQAGPRGTFSWEMPGRVSIFDLQLGPAQYKHGELKFQEDKRSINVDQFPDRLTLAVRFSYNSSQAEVPLKFMIRLPNTRQYEEIIRLPSRAGHYTYHFSIHNPRDFLGTGYIYLYYGFSIVDVLDFSISTGR